MVDRGKGTRERERALAAPTGRIRPLVRKKFLDCGMGDRARPGGRLLAGAPDRPAGRNCRHRARHRGRAFAPVRALHPAGQCASRDGGVRPQDADHGVSATRSRRHTGCVRRLGPAPMGGGAGGTGRHPSRSARRISADNRTRRCRGHVRRAQSASRAGRHHPARRSDGPGRTARAKGCAYPRWPRSTR